MKVSHLLEIRKPIVAIAILGVKERGARMFSGLVRMASSRDSRVTRRPPAPEHVGHRTQENSQKKISQTSSDVDD